jgi:hypothetical protein
MYGESDISADLPLEAHHRRVDPVVHMLEQAGPGLIPIRPETILCDDRVCHVEKDGRPLYIDDNHLNTEGVKLLVPLLKSVIETGQTQAQR